MKKIFSLDGEWRGFYGVCDFAADASDAKRTMNEIKAVVPGNLESDLENNGILPEIYKGENILLTQDYENVDYCLSKKFVWKGDDTLDHFLVFEGLDCISEVFIDGEPVGMTDNMLIPYRFPVDLADGEHELFVHIYPACVAAREYDIEPSVNASRYNYDSLRVRKAPSMYGWDIMPRVVSAGIWRHVYIESVPKCRITDIFVYTVRADSSKATLKFTFNTYIGRENVHKFRMRIRAACGESVLDYDEEMWHTGFSFRRDIYNPKLWMPLNYGEPNMYEITAELLKDGEVVDTYSTSVGIRTVVLDRTSTTDKEGSGEFRFIINGEPVFAMGSNWVPVDAVHSRDEERLPEILPMLSDIGCNIIRCWGGNVYENDILFDYCDRNGIMIWQDFTMACEIPPQDEEFKAVIRKEAEAIVKRLRNHPSLVLWAGDNECDCAYSWAGEHRDPNTNVITREVIPEVLKRLDYSRPYLPSSPYIDEEAFSSGKPTAEDHLWGPRDYFKGDYYKNTVCHFASETGYHGCPSPESLKKYIDEDHLWPCLGDRQWLVHAATMDGLEKSSYGYRIRLMWNQVVTLFGEGKATETLESFSLASQISQAEAKKYFIERFRLSKPRRMGIIWWNLIDGWPQISDAVVDYYLDKKLAYYYIKRSQEPFCMMFDEPDNGKLTLYAVNECMEDREYSFTVEDDNGHVILSGSGIAKSHESIPAAAIPASDEKRYYIIRWNDGEKDGINHYFANIIDIDLDYYKTLLEKLK